MGPDIDPRLVDSAIRHTLPYPLAALYAKSRSVHDASARYAFSLRLIEGVAAVLGFIGLADAAACGASDEEVSRWVRLLEQTGPGKLAALAKGTSQWLSRNAEPLLPEIAQLWDGPWEAALGKAIEFRNRYAHDDLVVPTGEAESSISTLRPVLGELLAGVQFLGRYHFGAFRALRRTNAGFCSYWYPSRGLEEAGQFVPVTMGTAPIDDAIAVFDPEFKRGLYLSPFLLWAPSAVDRSERLFWLRRTDQGVARYGHPVLRHEPLLEDGELTSQPPRQSLRPRSNWPGRVELRLDDSSRKVLLADPALAFSQDRFRLVGKIGEGAMGTVFEAQDTVLGQRRAIKFIRPELMRSPDALRRFRREAQLLASLESSTVVRVYDLDLSGDAAYIVMELVSGEDLASFIERTGSLTPERAIPIFVEICEAVGSIHKLGVVHRDLKPSNIMLDGPRVRLLDFGIALPPTGTRYSASIDRMGTPLFMAPEQWEGEASTRSDVFAAGKILAAMLLGRFPPMGERLASALVGGPSQLRAVILRATAPEPGDRYASIDELGRAARSALQQPAGSSAPDTAREPPSPTSLPPEPSPRMQPEKRAQVVLAATPPVGTAAPARGTSTSASWRRYPLTLRPKDPAERAAMESFARLWAPLRRVAESLGWRTNPGSIIELYFMNNPRSSCSEVFLSPYKPARFLFRATPRSGAEPVVETALRQAASGLAMAPLVAAKRRDRSAGTASVVEVVSTWNDVIGGGELSDQEVSARLQAFAEPLLRAITPR